MKILSANASANYLKQGTVPRTFVSIPDANLLMGTEAYTETTGDENTYENSLKQTGTISQSVEPYGGMAEVSGVTVKNLEIGDEFSLSSSVDIDPLPANAEPNGAGRVASFGSNSDNYATVRGVGSGTFSNGFITVGQRKAFDGFNTDINVYRGFMQFLIPSGITSIVSASLDLTGILNLSTTNFRINIIQGEWSAGGWGSGGMFDDFSNWESGDTAYSDQIILSESWRTEQYSMTETNNMRFNSDGKDAMLALSGLSTTFKLLLLSDRDYNGTEPSTGVEEYVRFDPTDVVLNIRYNTVNLLNQEATIYLAFADADAYPAAEGNLPTSVSDMEQVWTGVVDDWSINDKTVDLKLRQNNFKKNILIPKATLENTEFTLMPKDNNGIPAPFFYGNFFDLNSPEYIDGIGYYTDLNSDLIARRDYLKFPLLKLSAMQQAFVSSLNVKSRELQKYTYNESRDIFSIYPVNTRDISYGNHTIDELRTDNTDSWASSKNTQGGKVIADTPYGTAMALSPTSHIVNTNTILNPEYAFNEDITLFASMSGSAGVTYQFTQPASTSIISDNIRFFVTSTSGFAFMDIFFVDASGTANLVKTDTVVASGQFIFTLNVQSEIVDVYNEPLISIDQLAVKFRLSGGSTTFNRVFVMFGVEANQITEVYGYGSGVPFGSWIDASGRSNLFNENELIITPAFTMESIARDATEFVTADINTSSFDTGAGKQSDWNFAYQQLERENAMDILDKMAFECKTKIFWDNTDKLKIITFDANADFPVQGGSTGDSDIGDVPANLDIFEADVTVTGGKVATHPILQNSFKLKHIGIDKTKNDFILHYRKRSTNDSFRRTVFMTNDDSVTTNNTTGAFSFEFTDTVISADNLGAEFTFTFTDTGGSDTIDRSSGSFVSDGFSNGDIISVSGSLNNNDYYTILIVTPTQLGLVATDTLTNEAVATGMILSTLSKDTITTIASGSVDFVTLGFIAGDIIDIDGTVSNDGSYTVALLSSTTLSLVETDVLVTESLASGGTITARRTNITASALEDSQTESILKNKCADSFSAITTKNTFEYESEYVRDDDTATKLLQFYIERMTTDRLIAEFTTSINGLAHEVGDFINIRHYLIENLVGTAEMNVKKWEIINTELSLDGYNISIFAIEV